jgi:HupE / UreJ protein
MPGPPSQSAMSRLPSAGGWLVLFALAVLGAAARLRGHDIPNDVTVQAFVKPEGQTLRLLVRVPLLAMRDMDYPKRAGATNAELLDLARADSTLRDAATLWVADDVNIYEGDAKLAYPRVAEVRASLPSDRSFATYEEALAHVTGPRLPADTDLFWSQGMLDVLFEYRIQSDRSNFSFEPKLGRLGLRTLTVVRFMPPSGTARSFELLGDPGIVRLDPRWHQTARAFLALGFAHLLGGMDYVLFLCCLAMPFRRVGALAAVVTAFVVAHSITLIASAYSLAPDVLWFPPLVDLLIAASILYMALENIVSPQLQRRWIVTFAFGLAYGFAFSLALRQSLQFAGAHVVTSLVAFNVGVELAVLLVVAIAAPVFAILFRFLVAERLGTIVLSAFVVHTAWHWFSQRYSTLVRFRFQWPVIDAAFLALMMRWAMLAVILVGAYWVLSNLPSLKYEVRSQKQL